MITFLENDDYKSVCGCGEFPVTNTVIDGWECKAFQMCKNI